MSRQIGWAIAVLCLAGAAYADEEVPLLGAVTVTGTRLVSSEPSTTVVTTQDFERFNELRLTDALSTVSGLTPTPGVRGSPRGESRIYLRGFDGLQTPFLVDGVPFYVSWDGEPTDLDRFTLFDLAAVEVSKGYTPVAYGPGTLGGAINLVTRRPTRDFESNVAGSIITDRDGVNGYQADGNLGLRHGNFYAQLGASFLRRDSWDLPSSFAPAGPAVFNPLQGNVQPSGERLRSYSKDRKFSLKLGMEAGEGSEYALAIYDQHAEKGVPPYAGPPNPNQRFNYFDWPYWNKRGIYFLGQTAIAPGISLRTRLYYDKFGNSLYSYDNLTYSTMLTRRAFRSEYDDHSTGGSVVLDAKLGPGMLSLAGHLRNDYHKDIQTYPVRIPATLYFQDRTWSAGAEYRLPLAEHYEVAGSISRDSRKAIQAQDQNLAGASFALGDQSATNFQGQVIWRVDSQSNVHLSASRRGRFPSQFERYSYRLGSAIPNPDLKLERATTFDLGYTALLGEERIEASVFQSRLSDLIQGVTVSPGVIQNQNVGDARYTGVEFGGSGPIADRLRAGINYTYLNRVSLTTPPHILFGVPRHAAFVYLEWHPLEALEIVPSATVNSGRLTSDVASANGEPVGGFTTLDLRASYRLSPVWRVELAGRNLADRLYQLDLGYPREGRSVSFVVRGDF